MTYRFLFSCIFDSEHQREGFVACWIEKTDIRDWGFVGRAEAMAASSTSFFSVTTPLHLATPRSSKSSRSTVSIVQPQAGNSKTVDIAVPSFRQEGEGEDEWYEVPVHRVTVRDRQNGVSHSFEVPEDQYILQTGEDQQINLPFSCRHGCCTACAVRVKSGQLYQPQALGISAELKEKGYGLLCVGYPLSDLEVETQDEDEVYWLQFGQYFARGPLERDDFALELAVADE